MERNRDRYRGCLIGGAIGDAMGNPVEFMSLNRIKEVYGVKGIKDLVIIDHTAKITDDTQMTLFTSEGLLRARARRAEKETCDLKSVVYYAYQRWLYTQGYHKMYADWVYDSYLLKYKELYHQRAPGHTCLSALKSGNIGTPEDSINNSKGCGAVMRMAPVGLLFDKYKAFQYGIEFGALTHGHPSGYLSAGALACLISCINEGQTLESSLASTLLELKKYRGYEECSLLLEKAADLADHNISSEEAIPILGEGWIAEEALAIAIYCALKYQDNFKAGVLAAVNHDGDSDSTGAIAGNLLGAHCGIEKIPKQWIKQIELKDLVLEISDDLHMGYRNDEEWRKKYPSY